MSEAEQPNEGGEDTPAEPQTGTNEPQAPAPAEDGESE